MIPKKLKLMPKPTERRQETPEKLTYWRSSPKCFSIDYKGIITEICDGDLGYDDMDRMDAVIHAAIGCKQKDRKKCQLIEV
jgi:hypothetical protein